MVVASSDLTHVRSSVVFEIFLSANRWCLYLWLLIESLSFVYKNETIIYPSQGQLAGEIILMLSVFFVDLLRILLGSISNRTENILPLGSDHRAHRGDLLRPISTSSNGNCSSCAQN